MKMALQNLSAHPLCTRNVTCQFLKKPGMIKNENGIAKPVSSSTVHKKSIYVPYVGCINVLLFHVCY